MVFSGFFACAEQTAHPSSDTNSSRPKTLHPIDLDTLLLYHEDIDESAHFAKVYTVPKEVIQMRTKKVLFQWSFRKFSTNSSTIFWYSELLRLPRKFKMADFSARQAESPMRFNDSSKLALFLSSLISRTSNIHALRFSMLFRFNFSQRNPRASLFNAFTKFFMSPNLMCRGRSNTLLGKTKGRGGTLCDPRFNSCIAGQSCLT